MTSTDINSHDYWNGRFEQDWESNLGKEQSRFFASVALANMPGWLRSVANENGWKVCDWGCAQGDGTEVLANYFLRDRVTGVDFAESAVDKARAAYPGLRFETQDWITTHSVDEKFNIVFSSNTLEHFVDPFCVLSKLCERAEQCVVLALPYREINRISEHFFTFTAQNIPLVINTEWVLIHSAAIDCRSMDPTYWHGEQVILVYVNRSWAEEKGLSLADGSLVSEVPVSSADMITGTLGALQVENQRMRNDIAVIMHELEKQAQQRTAASADLVLERDAEINRLVTEQRQNIADRQETAKMLEEMKDSVSWRITAPLRLISKNLRRVFRG